MFSQLFHKTYNKLSFEDVQKAIQHNYTLINTLSTHKQDCLIQNTVISSDEEPVMNNLLNNYNSSQTMIIIYGENSSDNSVETKYNQLHKCGFYNIYIYSGGLFEWLLLQDIYGFDEFPTTSKILDILKYKPNKQL
tara:strand:- start:1360 stop:1767 length:408 start_codon:yes stop_codon:yes gene_type:complete